MMPVGSPFLRTCPVGIGIKLIGKGFFLRLGCLVFLRFAGTLEPVGYNQGGEYRAWYGFIVLALATDGFCRAVGQWPLQGGLEL